MKMPSVNRAATGGPSDGDLLIARDRSERQGYTLNTIPGPAQIRYRTYDQALAAASDWILQRGGATWLTEDHGKTFKPVATHTKPTTQTRATSGQHRPVKDA
jgi:hypothetical protein